MPNSFEVTEKSKSWNPWPWAIIAFFAVALLGCAVFVIFCIRNPTDLVAQDYYEQEIRYQAQMDRLRHAGTFGQRATIVHQSDSKQIVISLPPEHATANASGTIQLYRPSSAKMDRSYPLSLSTGGTQSIATDSLQPGLWKVRVLWRVGDLEYYLDRNVKISS